MDRARSILKVGILATGVMILVPLLAMSIYEELRLPGMIDLVWKVLVLLLLADISLKLGSRNGSKSHRDGQ